MYLFYRIFNLPRTTRRVLRPRHKKKGARIRTQGAGIRTTCVSGAAHSRQTTLDKAKTMAHQALLLLCEKNEKPLPKELKNLLNKLIKGGLRGPRNRLVLLSRCGPLRGPSEAVKHQSNGSKRVAPLRGGRGIK